MTRPNLIIDARFISEGASSSGLFDTTALDGFELDLQSQLDAALDSPAFDNDPTGVAATQITWGDAINGATLTGSGLSQINNLEQLETELQMGIASGAFDTLSIIGGGQTVATLSFSATGLTFASGAQSLAFTGTIPSTLQGIFDVIGALTELSDEPDLDAVATTLQALDVDAITLSDGAQTVLQASFAPTAITLNVGGGTLQATGTFPTGSVGALLNLIQDVEAIEDSSPEGLESLTQIPGLAIDALSLTAADGTVLLRTSGPIQELDTPFEQVIIEGTEAADGTVFASFSDSEARSVDVDLKGGNDIAQLEGFFDNPADMTVDGGAGIDTLVVDDFSSGEIQVDMFRGTVTGFERNNLSPEDAAEQIRYVTNFSNFEVIDLSFGERGVVFGDDRAETVILSQAFGRADVYGGGGIDTLDLSQIFLSGVAGSETGLKVSDASEFVVSYMGNSTIVLRHPDVFTDIHLGDVEQVTYLSEDGTGTVTGSVQDLLSLSNNNSVFNTVIYSFVFGTSEADSLAGGAGAQAVLGQSGNDFLYGDGLGVDAFFAESAQVFRMYQATLGRTPDSGGHEGWVRDITEGKFTITDVAGAFVGSREFSNTYGALDDTSFVELLYQNVLGRASDPGGLQTWLDVLGGGGSRADVVLGFSDSREFVNATRADANAYTIASTEQNWTDEVYRIYRATLDREADQGGLLNWTGELSTGTALVDVVAGFTNSREFQNTYGQLDDAGFVELLYQNVLNRASDAGGLQGWLEVLDGGGSRADVVLGFSESREFIAGTAMDVDTWVRGEGVQDVIDGGSGTTSMFGGVLADAFVFSAVQGGTHTVYDLEEWDQLWFNDFGYETAQDVGDNVTVQGSNLVFEDQGVTITFVDTAQDTNADIRLFELGGEVFF